MTFRTQIQCEPSRSPIDYDSNILLLGSCFAGHISEKLQFHKFRHLGNPFGIIFHSIGIEKLVLRAINQEVFKEEELIQNGEFWYSFDAHSEISSAHRSEVLSSLNSALNDLGQALQNSSHLILTLGTAWVYRYIESDSIVSNCHKVPQKKFLKELLSVEDVIASLENTLVLIRSVNPQIEVIITVSPVRHLKDGMVENMRSKSQLISAVHQIVDTEPAVTYFPSFEMLMDDLRDYRFYEADMIHPNTVAVDYVWDKFRECWINPQAYDLMKEIETVQKGLHHRPFHPESESHQEFLRKIEGQIASIQERLPFIRFDR